MSYLLALINTALEMQSPLNMGMSSHAEAMKHYSLIIWVRERTLNKLCPTLPVC